MERAFAAGAPNTILWRHKDSELAENISFGGVRHLSVDSFVCGEVRVLTWRVLVYCLRPASGCLVV